MDGKGINHKMEKKIQFTKTSSRLSFFLFFTQVKHHHIVTPYIYRVGAYLKLLSIKEDEKLTFFPSVQVTQP